MKKSILLLLLIPFISFSQNLTFIGENSYPSTIEFEFENKEKDLFITFLKDNENILIMLKTEDAFGLKPTIDGKMIMYLDSGKVISSIAPSYKDYVDEFCISIYPIAKSDITDIILGEIKQALKRGDRVELRGFGVFSTNIQKARISRNPKTGEKVNTPEKKTIHFKMSKDLFKKLNDET